MEVQPSLPAPAPSPPSWSNLLKQTTESHKNSPDSAIAAVTSVHSVGGLVGSCKSSKGIAVAVVDANALINGGERLFHSSDRFVSISEVINEIRDPSSRHSLSVLPFTVETLEPTPEALSKVINFAKATGDFQTLSEEDLKLIALTYTLESQIHGTQNIRDAPPPIHTVNVKRLPEKDLPGWSSNIPNLEEWEALEQALDNGPDPKSRILSVKDLSFGVDSTDQRSVDNGSNQDGIESHIENNQEAGDSVFRNPRRYMPKKREIKIVDKKMVADGIDASLGASDDNSGDWLPAVSRSTHRRFLRRKARHEMNEAPSELGDQVRKPDNVENVSLDDDQCPELLIDETYEETENGELDDVNIVNAKNRDGDVTASVNKMKLEEESIRPFHDSDELSGVNESSGIELRDSVHNVSNVEEPKIIDQSTVGLDMKSETNESMNSVHLDDASSEQSWTLRSLSQSSVACVTSDFAMQNVLLQMGLRLLAPGGKQIRELHRWVLKCHACFKVTTDTTRIFCPNCGNGGTLRKVAVTVNDNGIVLAARPPRVSLRGTKFSLPLPQGGRDAVTRNPILREDQLPQKYLYPKIKKKNKQEDEFFVPDNVFRNHGDKKASSLQPPIRRTLAVFSGKRNPNDNHYARSKA